MAKTIPLHDDDLLFLDVLPELHPDFIKKNQEISSNVSPNNIAKQ